MTENPILSAGTPSAEVQSFVTPEIRVSDHLGNSRLNHDLRPPNPEANSSLVNVTNAKSVYSSDVATIVRLSTSPSLKRSYGHILWIKL